MMASSWVKVTQPFPNSWSSETGIINIYYLQPLSLGNLLCNNREIIHSFSPCNKQPGHILVPLLMLHFTHYPLHSQKKRCHSCLLAVSYSFPHLKSIIKTYRFKLLTISQMCPLLSHLHCFYTCPNYHYFLPVWPCNNCLTLAPLWYTLHIAVRMIFSKTLTNHQF